MTFTSNSEEETIAIGRQLSALLPAFGPVLLIGNLGAGKTTLVKGIAQARGAAEADEVSSPTFPLIHEYGEPPVVYHVDLYRLDTLEEVATLGLEDLLDGPALVLIEWGERFPSLWPLGTPRVELQATGESSETARRISFL
jgi:tRNA threonylcarbamoyladenosine biosynthesis protein TsaE